jgi:hypothetical protein
MPLFEVAILENPTKKAAEDGIGQKLIFGPKAIIARDIQSAAMNAVMDNPVDPKIDRSRLEVLVRPFAG